MESVWDCERDLEQQLNSLRKSNAKKTEEIAFIARFFATQHKAMTSHAFPISLAFVQKMCQFACSSKTPAWHCTENKVR